MSKSFGEEMFSGVLYTAIAKYSGIIVSLIITAVLARMITPEDFGVVAIATVFISFFAILSDLGLGAAIVQKQDLTSEDLSSLFSFSIYLGLILTFLFFIASTGIALFYKNTILLFVCRLLSLNILFSTLNVVPNSLLLKNKKFKFIAIRTFIVQLIAGIISVILALVGAGIYALLVNPIIGSAIIFIINYKQYPLPFHCKIEKRALNKVASYSLYQFGFTIINYFVRNLDKLMIGRVIGLQVLGYYEKSYRLMMLPLQNITNVVTPVMHPIFADYQNNLTIQRDKFLKILRILSLIGFPLTAFLYFSARELVLVIFGPQWEASVPIFKILSLTVWCQIIGSSLGSIFQATNQTKRMFYVGLINTIVNVTGLFIAIFVYKTAESVAWMMVLTFYLSTWNFWYIFRAIFHSSVNIFIKGVIPAILSLLILGVTLYVFSCFVSGIGLLVSLCFKIVIYMIVLICSLHVTHTLDMIKTTKSLISKVKRNNASA